MATNQFFRNNDYVLEQRLLDDLTEEMIKIFGIDVYYLPRNTGAVDEIFTEAPNSSFDRAIELEMYINTYEGFQGQGDLLSKFGLNVEDKLTLSVSRRRFFDEIGNPLSFLRPREGDLVYFPFTKGVFEIKFVEHEATFYQTGSLQYFELQLEKFSYNSETFSTGIPEIDSVYLTYSTTDENYLYLTQDGNNLITEDGYDIVKQDYILSEIDPSSQNDEFQIQSDTFTDFTIHDPFSEGGRY
jgi:hypothetical protein